MMLNSKGNYKRLLLALICGSVSFSTVAKVYSWRDADGAMHYSQFPRQIVEKNAAQSRASRKYADMNDVVNNLSPAKKVNNLLDGLDDIIANANVERQIDKVLTRRNPQLVLIEQQLARQQAQQQALRVAKYEAFKVQQALVAAANIVEENNKVKQIFAKNSFMAGIHRRVYGNIDTKSNDVAQPILPTQLALTSSQALNSIANVEIKQPRKVTNTFLAAIQNKLKRKHSLGRSVEAIQPAKKLQSAPTYIVEPVEAITVTASMVAVKTPLIEQTDVLKLRELKSEGLKPVVASRSIAKVSRKAQSKPHNAFLAGIKKKLNRNNETHVIAEPVLLARQNKSLVERQPSADKLNVTPEQVQNKFLVEINKKLFRTHLAMDKSGTGITPVAELVKSNTDINAKRHRTTTVKNKELTQGADQIKAIENAISSRSESNKVTTPSVKQVNSALMLSRLSYNHKARLPLSGAGTNQLARQDIVASSQFVNEVNRNAE
ncbi:DUF4124 domain-containing protein [Moritella sp.]|uniref:DUF4124 domain-containing protein n=1 Tax=Moritella sp. TaxID=78556 RepID=UPI001DCD78C0|nr:DUF4124 domain-containing protein [Moritella sp.]MCJ8347992.1 DUF4124 domain-containing protein [Moritella sp.]NQZ40335.1 DUF4124 domain-containing protein [Moritella sp.]